MSTRRVPLISGELYHIVYRAVGNAIIFNKKNDFYRGIFSIYEFNNKNPVDIWLRRKQRKSEKIKEKLQTLEGPTLHLQLVTERDLLVEILAFCFMPNHIHLLLKQLKDNGISQFIQKVGTGYAIYFNKKYNRKGHLFNKFKAIPIKTNNQLKNVLTYIHCNPISLVEPGWKEKGIKNPKKVIKFLNNYRRSSYQDYIGIKNFSSLTNRDFLLKVMNGKDGCREEVENWIKYKKEMKDFGDIILE